jgi:hypothetical protein
MADKRLWEIVAPFVAVALMIVAVHIFKEHQAYKTGIYMGNAFFKTEDYKNRQCLRVRGDSFRRVCEVKDLNKDSDMEDALASAYIIPSLSDSTALHTGFRDGWREARTAAFANR